jgi:hypothetical protein
MIDVSMAIAGTPVDGRRRDIRGGLTRNPIDARGQARTVHPLARLRLECGNVLRIRDGRTTVVRALSGTLWITEEGCIEDTVLLAGGFHRIENQGTTLVLAHRTARVVLEADRDAPRTVEMAAHEGEPMRRVALRVARSRMRRAIAAATVMARAMLSRAMGRLSSRS